MSSERAGEGQCQCVYSGRVLHLWNLFENECKLMNKTFF
jgi:hypothetical protein